MKLGLRIFFTGLCIGAACLGGFGAKRNVVLILADDMSPHLSFLKKPGINTPAIDALARQGVYFENAFSASASCSPSRTAILTGMWPHSNGNWRNVHTPSLDAPDSDFTKDSRIRDGVGIGEHVSTLPELLKKAGYYTAITQKLHLSPAWRYPYDARNSVQSTPSKFKEVISGFMNEAGERPFFIHANVAAPHRPYRSHLARNPNQKLPDADTIDIPAFLPREDGVVLDMQEYYACVEIADACVQAIVEALEAADQRDNTLIIFTSDQGMPIHHAKASGYPGGMRIPLAILGPEIDSGRVSAAAVSQIDYAPTILDYCGLEIPDSIQGRSLVPILAGDDVLEGRRFIFAEHNSHGPDKLEHYPQRVVTDGRWYYIRNLDQDKSQRLPDDLRGVAVWGNHAHAAIMGVRDANPFQAWFLTRFSEPRGKEHFYDLSIDPWGINDLVNHSSVQGLVDEFRDIMENWRRQTSDIKCSPLEIQRVSW